MPKHSHPDGTARGSWPGVWRHWTPRIGAVMLALSLGATPALRAAETQLTIRLTPGAAAIIATLQQGRPLPVVLASMPQPGSERAFMKDCHAEGGAPEIRRNDSDERVCL